MTTDRTAGPSRSRQPNVVLINCDDLGYGDLGCYGSELHDTPAIDALAKDGVLLTDFYAASAVCSPSRAALLTSCYPPRIGFGDFDGAPVLFPGHPMGLHPAEITMAGGLSAAGYATSLVGKWHCGDQPEFLPTEHGFDEYFGLPYSNDMGVQRWHPDLPPYVEFLASFGIELSVDEMPPLPLVHGDSVIESQPDQTDLTERYLEESLRFIRANATQPFFLYLAHMYVHVPLYVQERFADASRNGSYGAAVACIDWVTGAIVAELEELGLTDDTIIVFTSDNGSRVQGGGGSNTPLRSHKGTTWEGGQRVPCIVKWPGHIPPGTSSAELSSAMDLWPTVAGWCGATLPTDRTIDGRDISPVLIGEPGAQSPHEAFFYYRGDILEAVRSKNWKLHVFRGEFPVCELFDLEADIGERDDVADAHPEVVARLEGIASAARADLGDAGLGITGAGRRPVGRVDNPNALLAANADAISVVAEYDLIDRG